jgi:hypothetical protein
MQWEFAAATAKETQSLNLRYGADLLQFAVSPLITEASTRSRKQKKQRDYKISDGTACILAMSNNGICLCCYRLSYTISGGEKGAALTIPKS